MSSKRQELAEPVEYGVCGPSRKLRPRKIHPSSQGFEGLFFRALGKGVTILKGAGLRLVGSEGLRHSDISMQRSGLAVRVMGSRVLTLSVSKLKTPSLEVGKPGESSITLYTPEGERRHLCLDSNGEIQLRRTKPTAK